jgi:transcription termination/antitermination protein NusG
MKLAFGAEKTDWGTVVTDDSEAPLEHSQAGGPAQPESHSARDGAASAHSESSNEPPTSQSPATAAIASSDSPEGNIAGSSGDEASVVAASSGATESSAEALRSSTEELAAEPSGLVSNGVPAESPPEEIHKEWYILKVQSNREESIREGLLRRVTMAGLDRYFGECIVPTEMVSEFKGGKKRVSKRKLYPGYLVVNMEINDDTWYLVRETPGIGDFTGSIGRPSPMLPQDVQKILAKSEEKTDEAPKLKIAFKKGDRVKVNEGTFENFEGDVEKIDEANGRVIVTINIFGRSTPVELEYWQIESV